MTATLTLNDSLFNTNSERYTFAVGEGRNAHLVDLPKVQDLNYFMKIENNQLKFKIIHNGDCKPIFANLVYSGKEYFDSLGTPYYILKFVFSNIEPCEKLTCTNFIFDVNAIKSHRIKFFGFDNFIN